MVNLIDKDFAVRFQDAVAIIENEAGYKLERQDAERLIIQVLVSLIQQGAIAWENNGQQLFLESMSGNTLDAYGANFGTTRLSSQPATALVRFTFLTTLKIDTYIYENTVIAGTNSNGTYDFKVKSDTLIPAGSSFYDIEVEEFTSTGNSGADANDIEVGDLNQLDDSQYDYSSFLDTVANITKSSGGLANETDEHFRDRLFLAPAQYASAGTKDAYIFHAKSASQNVADANLKKDGWEIVVYVLPKNYDGSFNLVINGDAATQLADLSLSGLTLSNTDDGVLYWELTGIAPNRTFDLYSDSAKTTQVATGTAGADGNLVITAVGGSGITGTVDVTYTIADSDAGNTIQSSLETVKVVDDVFNVQTDVRPINDIVSVSLPNPTNFSISSIVAKVYSGYSIADITSDINNIVNTWLENLKVTLGIDAVKSQLIGYLHNIDGLKEVTITFSTGTDSITVNEDGVPIGTWSSANLTITGGESI